MSRPIIRSTVACVIREGERFLMVEEDKGSPLTLFNQPAGHIELGEGPKAALLREVREETAWHVSLTSYLGLYVLHTEQGDTFHSHGFVATPLRSLGTPLDNDILATHWLTRAEIAALASERRLRSPLVLQRIDDALAGRHYPLDVIHE
ncbi:NUDIX hydrolase [Halomonas sp. 141]|uniref:NUDIX domain-containing protein n=1 Tax=Halomonas sp. 141 TaxID=2056666 RepID=UPI000C29DBBC|nr:NUDIX domain-containing protein [Halomonas sp. 141]PJX14681.1 NUDIX hydrolase [Halomonas sp. 141]